MRYCKHCNGTGRGYATPKRDAATKVISVGMGPCAACRGTGLARGEDAQLRPVTTEGK